MFHCRFAAGIYYYGRINEVKLIFPAIDCFFWRELVSFTEGPDQQIPSRLKTANYALVRPLTANSCVGYLFHNTE